MKWTEARVAEILERGPAAAPPPADLLPRLKAAIPLPEPVETATPSRRARRALAIAAVVLMSVTGAYLARQLVRPEPVAVTSAVAPAVPVAAPPPAAPPAMLPAPAPLADQAALVAPPCAPTMTMQTDSSAAAQRSKARSTMARATPTPVRPAVETGTLTAKVMDAEGLALPGVTVEIASRYGRREAYTDAQGLARFADLQPATTELVARLDGFNTVEQRKIQVAPGKVARTEVVLAPGMKTAIDVIGSAPVVHLSSTTSGASISADLMESVPVGRAFAETLQLAPGTNVDPATTTTQEGSEETALRLPPGFGSFADAAASPLTTFALDVDTGSYSRARAALLEDQLPPPGEVRVEEFVNALRYDDAGPSREDFAISTEVSTHPFGARPGNWLLRIALKARPVAPIERKPLRLTLLVDVSGSMEGEERIGLVKRSVHLLLDALEPRDRIAVVAFADDARLVLGPSDDREAAARAIDGVEATDDSTNTARGLALAYQIAGEQLDPGASNRVVLLSDGVANVGETSIDGLLAQVAEGARSGIELTTVGVGTGSYNDAAMEQLADRGNGRYAFIDTLDEARRDFVTELVGTVQTVATDARVQVALNPHVVRHYRLLGYENRAMPDESFRDDTRDAGEVGAGHAVTALYEIEPAVDASSHAVLGVVRLRWKPEGGGAVREIERTIATSWRGVVPWESASASFRLASVAAELAERLRGAVPPERGRMRELLARARTGLADIEGRPEVAELGFLVEAACKLQDPSFDPHAAPAEPYLAPEERARSRARPVPRGRG